MIEGTHLVTGGFGFTGRYILRELLARGLPAATLTQRLQPSGSFPAPVPIITTGFDDPEGLSAALRGVAVLYNTHWVRFPHGGASYDTALRNIETLLRAATAAGVGRVVHISVTNADPDSPFPYFRGKGVAEALVRDSGLSCAILRPALVFGPGDILLNNIAWFLRRLPVFGIPEGGGYELQPIAAEDLARLVVTAGQDDKPLQADALGPERLSFREMVQLLRDATGSRAWLPSVSAGVALAAVRLAGAVLGDVVLTPEELGALQAGLLTSSEAPLGEEPFSRWVAAYGPTLGRTYRSELSAHYRTAR